MTLLGQFALWAAFLIGLWSAGLAFLARWQAGMLQADYRDQACDSAFQQRVLGASDVVGAFCAEPAIWGELAGSQPLTAALRTAHLRILPLAHAAP